MADAVAGATGWLDAVKHGVMAQIATALAAPETVGPNLWSALRDMGKNLAGPEDTGSPVQNSRNLMMGFGTAPLGVVKFPGGMPRLPTYGVEEHAGLPPELTQEQLAKVQDFLAKQALAAKVVQFPGKSQ